MAVRGTNSGNNTLTNTGNNCRLSCTAYQTVNIGTNGYSCLNLQLNTIASHSRNHRCLNNLWINTHLHCFQHITTSQIYSGRTLKRQRYLCSVSCNQSIHYLVHITTSQEMRLQLIYLHIKTSLIGLNKRQNNLGWYYLTHSHPHQGNNIQGYIGCSSRNPQSQGYKMQKQANKYNGQQNPEKSHIA